MKAFAAIENGADIVIDTVSSHDRDAMIKWLAYRAGYVVPHGMGDFAIRDQFARQSLGRAKIETVEITYGQ